MKQIEVEDRNSNNTTEPEHKPWRSNRIRIQNQGVERTGDIGFEYINLQGTFGEQEPCSPEEIIVQIKTPNERYNYYNTMEFIANDARRDHQMIEDYILTQYSLKAGVRKF